MMLNGVTKRIFNLLKAAVIILVVVKLTTFGWRPVFQKPLQSTDAFKETVSNLRSTVKTLSVDIGVRNLESYENLNKSAQYIQDSLKAYGYEVIRQDYAVDGKDYHNIIARSNDWDDRKEIIIVGAHYDSCFTLGADDNASGIAGLLEVARLLKNEPSANQVQFVAFTNEEPPYFSTSVMGSRVYTRWLHRHGFKVKVAVIFEMLGFYSDNLFSQRYLPLIGSFYPNQGNFIAAVGNFPSKDVLGKLVHYFKKSSSFPMESLVAPSFLPGIYFSDHASFWREGYPAVMVTDTAYLRNKHYHKQSDQIETINFYKMSYVVHGLKEAILKIASE